ncbi:MAG: UvrD-helicase domain-containing protein, partial [Candidatus Desulforudaceae bacterium]
RTAAALRDNPGMRRYLQGRFTHLLVDEFQDTDPIQAEVMLYLTGRDCDEKDWRQLVPRPGSLFVVGDPKQSIYRFRRADIDTYNLVKKLITESGGRLLHLDTNFRSQSSLAKFINPVFESAFPEEPTAVQAANAPMHTIREPAPDTLAGVYRITVPRRRGHYQNSIAQFDATRLAAWIRWVLDQELLLNRSKDEPPAPIRPDDILILLRYKGELSIYARALEAQGIPYSISGGIALKHSTILAEAHQLLTVLERPDDPVNLVGALRGPFFGFSDQELLDYRDAKGVFSIFASVPDAGLVPDTAEAFTDALDKLRHYYRWSRTLPPATAARQIFEDIGILGWIATESAGLSGAASALLVRELLAATESGGETTFGGLVRKLGELLESGVDNELDIYAGSRSAVRLMNLHRAKGLEAPVVCLAHPGRSVSRDPSLHVDRTTDHPQGHLQICQHSPFGGAGPVVATPPDWANLQATEKEYEEAEELRLVYVGATRAKDVLIVSWYPDKPEASPWKTLNAALANVPELPDPEADGTVDFTAQIAATAGVASQSLAALESPEATVAEYETFCTALPATWDAGRKPSYAANSVTELAKEANAPKRHATGKGVSWGNAVHRMLEKLLEGEKDLDTWAARILAEEGRPVSEASELTDLMHEVQKTPFWKRVESAHERLSEVPLGCLFNTSAPTGETLPTVTKGIIDLAFREDTGWVLVDFKTDYYETEGEKNALVDYYATQLKTYAELWKMATGESPRELGLLFTHKKDCVLL